jgi:S1-C subfamily serine protease
MRAEAASGREKGTQPEGALGLNLQQLTPQIANELEYKGSGKVVVAGVRPGSPADSGGIERGDVIVEADKKTVQSPSDIADAAKDGKVMLRVERKSGSFFTVLSKED